MAVTNATPRFAERVECGSMHAAEAIREQFADALHREDDARRRVVLVSVDAPPSVKHEIGRIAAESWSHERYGSADLTAFEREQIDFTETNVMHARAVKAIAKSLEVDDWLAYYDTTLSVDEHRSRLRQQAGDDLTMRDLPMLIDQGGQR